MSEPSERFVNDRSLFDNIAEQYCRKDLVEASSIARRHRLEQTLDAINVGNDIDLLEVGCGAGFTARYLEGRYATYTGVDYSEELVALAGDLNATPGAQFVTSDIGEFKSDKLFDVVILIGVIHHFDEPVPLMSRIRNLVKPGGWIIANEPQPANPVISLARKVRKKVDDNYSEDQDELDSTQLREIFTMAGLSAVTTVPQGIFSTPFAEVVMPIPAISRGVSKAACAIDRYLERQQFSVMEKLTWNLVVAGQRPTSDTS